MMLALPLECNVTGTRYSNDTLDALCQGRVMVPHLSPDVRSPVYCHAKLCAQDVTSTKSQHDGKPMALGLHRHAFK